MTAARVDRALFRLRTFEVEWVAPLTSNVTGFDDRLAAPRHDRFDRQASVALLNYVLLLEAQRWIAMGQDVGYFARAPVLETFEVPLAVPQVAWIVEEWHSDRAIADSVDIQEFGRVMFEAQGDLTPERREFLRLICFAGSAEWDERLEEVARLSRAFARQPDLVLPYAEVDRVEWSLEGAESSIATAGRHFPADWRSTAFSDVARRSPEASARLSDLQAVRAAVAEAALAPDRRERTWGRLRRWRSHHRRRAGLLHIPRKEELPELTRNGLAALLDLSASWWRFIWGRLTDWVIRQFVPATALRGRRPEVRRLEPREEVFERLRAYLAREHHTDPVWITESAHFERELGMDSFALVELVGEVERVFGVDMGGQNAARVRTVGQAVDFILAHQAAPILEAEARRVLEKFNRSERSREGRALLDAYKRLAQHVATRVGLGSDHPLSLEDFVARPEGTTKPKGSESEVLKLTITAIVRVADKSGRDRVSRDVYPQLIEALTPSEALDPSQAEQVNRTFEKIDVDNDGQLSAEELVKAVDDYWAGELEEEPLGQSVLLPIAA